MQKYFFNNIAVGLILMSIMKSSQIAKTIVWFRNDLRIHDNAVLHEAMVNSIQKNNEVMCVYCFDPRHFTKSKYGSVKCDKYRGKFLIESVYNLRRNLQSLGSQLFVAVGQPEDILPKLVINNEKTEILVQSEPAYEEYQVESNVKSAINNKIANTQLRVLPNDGTLYHIDDLPYKGLHEIPDVFTPFLKKLEQHTKPRNMLPSLKHGDLRPSSSVASLAATLSLTGSTCGLDYLPTLQDLLDIGANTAHATTNTNTNNKAIIPVRGVLEFIGGEDAALRRVSEWMWRDDNLKDYFDIRNGMLGEKYSTKLSPWLALGCISTRYILSEVKRYESERVANKSTYWLIWELTCRDFYRFISQKYNNRIFYSSGAKNIKKVWSTDRVSLQRWKEGSTGVPIVDANMRELKHTGFMSNRGRQIVASYLIFELNLDWRLGADHFESLLIDHDVYVNYANWNAAAGLTGGRINRFNMSKQSRDYDINGEYIHHWVSELKTVSAPAVFEPWLLSLADQTRVCVELLPYEEWVCRSQDHATMGCTASTYPMRITSASSGSRDATIFTSSSSSASTAATTASLAAAGVRGGQSSADGRQNNTSTNTTTNNNNINDTSRKSKPHNLLKSGRQQSKPK